jgi:hypothetical protein
MWAWAGCSDRPRRTSAALALGFAAGLLLPAPATARVLLGQEEALAEVFPPPARVERKTLFLTDAQAERIERESGERIPGRLVAYYVGTGEEGGLGTAYFDSHLVRTLPETILVLVRPDGTIGRVSILSFDEPADYLPKPAWLEQFEGRGLGPELALRRGIRNLTGASLTARAITAACRRILAVDRIVRERDR